MFTWTYIEFACVSELRNMTHVFRHEVAVFVDAPTRARKHCGPLLVDVFHIQVHGEFSSQERCVSVSVCVCVCKRGLYTPDAVKRITNTGITLAKLFPGFYF